MDQDQCIKIISNYYNSSVKKSSELDKNSIPFEILNKLKLDDDSINSCIEKSIKILKNNNKVKPFPVSDR